MAGRIALAAALVCQAAAFTLRRAPAPAAREGGAPVVSVLTLVRLPACSRCRRLSSFVDLAPVPGRGTARSRRITGNRVDQVLRSFRASLVATASGSGASCS